MIIVRGKCLFCDEFARKVFVLYAKFARKVFVL